LWPICRRLCAEVTLPIPDVNIAQELCPSGLTVENVAVASLDGVGVESALVASTRSKPGHICIELIRSYNSCRREVVATTNAPENRQVLFLLYYAKPPCRMIGIKQIRPTSSAVWTMSIAPSAIARANSKLIGHNNLADLTSRRFSKVL